MFIGIYVELEFNFVNYCSHDNIKSFRLKIGDKISGPPPIKQLQNNNSLLYTIIFIVVAVKNKTYQC